MGAPRQLNSLPSGATKNFKTNANYRAVKTAQPTSHRPPARSYLHLKSEAKKAG